MKSYALAVGAGMVVVALVVWFVPGAAAAVENAVLGVLSALMGY